MYGMYYLYYSKRLFSGSAPVLVQPDPICQFIVEVDVSAHSKTSLMIDDDSVHPVVFFSNRNKL